METPRDQGTERAPQRQTATPGGSAGTDVERPIPRSGEGGSAQSTSPTRQGTGRSVARSRHLAGSPLQLLQRMSEEMDQLFQSVVGARPGLAPGRSTGLTGPSTTAMPVTPQIEVREQPGALVVRADLPGLNADEIDVSVNDGVLTISGERVQQRQADREGVAQSELVYGAFHRAIPLPEGADEEHVAATFRNGVLEVTVPVPERSRGRRIGVTT
jgi:HSP20 family protein